MSAQKSASRRSTLWLNALALAAATLAIAALTWKNSQAASPQAAAFDPARELSQDLDSKIVKAHGIAAACSTTIVFVVRKGNPKSIHDWPDLVRPGVSAVAQDPVAADPRNSEQGRASFLAAWGSVTHRGGGNAAALSYVRRLYSHASASGVGDVRLTWENAALLETAGSRGDYEIVYPPVSIRAEPGGASASTKAYSRFLLTAPAQEILAQHGYRPSDPAILKEHARQFPAIELFPIGDLARDWNDADRKFFAPGAIFDQAKAKNQARPVNIALSLRP